MNSINVRIAGHVLLLMGWMTLSVFWYTCRFKNLCISDAFAATENLFVEHSAPFGLKVEGTPIALNDNIRFYRSGNVPIIPAAVKRAFNRTQSHLTAHDDLVIEVTGAYTSKEKNSSLLGSLGQSRAEAIKAWLIDQGISRSQIITREAVTDTLTFSHDTLMNALTFRVIDREVSEAINQDTLRVVNRRLHEAYEPLYLYPKTSDLIVTPEVKQYVWDLRTYLDDNPQKTITLTGHTDESSDQDTNFRMARAQAASVRQTLIQAGINRQQISITSKGSQDPVKDDGSKVDKNKRVEITFNK